jgi:molybdopterin-containing oxidoreductase family membrane subunit
MPRSETRGLVGVFREVDRAAEAVRALRASGREDLQVYSPVPDHELLDAAGASGSPLGYATLIGGIVGLGSGIALSLYATHAYELIVQGKPLHSWLPWVVVGFEFTILFGALANFAAMLIGSGLPRLRPAPGYDERFSLDHFGVFVPCDGAGAAGVRAILETKGAVEIHEHV